MLIGDECDTSAQFAAQVNLIATLPTLPLVWNKGEFNEK